MSQLEKDLKEIKDQLSRICQVLGIGAVPHIQVSAIKLKAKARALEIRNKKNIKSHGG